MNIWIFNPYEPLPFEGAVRLRYASLAEALLAQGHAVIWWSADWSHALKKRRLFQQKSASVACPLVGRPNQVRKEKSVRPAEALGERARHEEPELQTGNLKLELISVPAYHKNISLRRVWSHYCYARGIAKQAEAYAEKHGKPDVILFSVPPMEAGRVALKLGKKFGAKVVLDVMDAWPETLLMAMPAVGEKVRMFESMKVLGAKLLLAPYARLMRNYCREADAICGQSQAFAEYARSFGATGELSVFHLAAHKPQRAKTDQLRTEKIGHQKSEIGNHKTLRVLYLGSMGRVYDLSTLVEAVIQLTDLGAKVHLDVIGDGEQRRHLESMVAESGKTDVGEFIRDRLNLS